jgi:PAS domain S-box-containing protein
MVGSLTDITLRKQAEELLRQSDTFINSVVEHLPNMVFVKEASDLRFVRFNKAGEELLGYRRDTLLGKNDYDFFPKEEADFFTAKDREVLSSGRLLDIPEEVIHTVNGPRILRTQKVPICDAGGNPQYLLGISEDITERKRMEAQHEQISQDLHDNILQSLYAVGMQLEVSRLVIGKNPRKSKDHITRAIKQLNHLVMDVREFITLLQRRTVPKLDFGQALRQLASSFSTTAWDAPDIVIETPAVSALLPEQSKQLLSIAREALSNSQRHAQATRRWIRFDKTIETIRLEIGDDGIGFDPKQCRRRGHGLLNMAARAKNISARFTLDSAPSRGTRITVAIPLKGKSKNETRSARRRARP